ncbi:alpha/beta hydrolase [Actinoallomurus sp. NPDC052308]|uniref:alpha/beta fold hydrolase n=1 Tax=Actinoallomurus sp. NPDC052308 TaxID=3155530 RepID=UPI0034299944
MIDQEDGAAPDRPRPDDHGPGAVAAGVRTDEPESADGAAGADERDGTGASPKAAGTVEATARPAAADEQDRTGVPPVPPGTAGPVPADRPRRPWWRRWARRLGLTALALAVCATLFSFIYNAATAGRVRPPAGLTYVRTGDLLTRYRAWGSGGSPIVLVHGAAESADTWEPVAELLARDHRVYALDLNGSGYTSRRAPYDLDHQTRQLLAFLDALGLRRPVLVGHSSGAAAIADAALRSPDRVGGLMFLDGDALSTGAGPPPAFRHLVISPYRTTILRLVVRSDWVIRTIYSAQCGPGCPRLDAAGVEEWRRPFQVAGAESGIWGMLRYGVPGLPPDRLTRLRSTGMPKAVVYGAEDHVFAKDSAAQTARRIGAPDPTLIPGARHLTLISAPSQVARAVEDLAARRAP